jgi:hypothetical protein
MSDNKERYTMLDELKEVYSKRLGDLTVGDLISIVIWCVSIYIILWFLFIIFASIVVWL